MKSLIAPRATRLETLLRLCGFGLFGLCASASAASAAEFDTLYLRDGSVLKGTIIHDAQQHYMVFTPFGELAVEPAEVIYATRSAKTPPVINETLIFIGRTTETISIVEQDVPERSQDAPGFNRLLQGVVESVLTENGEAVPYKSRLVGENSLLTIQYADLPAKTQRLRITLWRPDLLTPLDADRAKFTQQYTAEREGTACVTVKYPKDWKIRSITPPPARRFDGLIVWSQALRRQQSFTPEITFQFEKR